MKRARRRYRKRLNNLAAAERAWRRASTACQYMGFGPQEWQIFERYMQARDTFDRWHAVYSNARLS